MIIPRNTRHPPCWLSAALCIAALSAILLLTWWAYHPGLSGAFLFDDLGSLPKLGATGPVDNWATFWRYITSGSADPTGRPLAMLSFLIDGHNWPTDPYPFKLTNVILHLLNGALLAWVLWRLGKVLASPRAARSVLRATLPAEGRESVGGEAASLPPSERRAERKRTRAKRGEGDGSHAPEDIPPPLRGDPLRSEGGECASNATAFLPPSKGRAERKRTRAKRGEEDGFPTHEDIPPPLRGDPLRSEGGECASNATAFLPPSKGRGIEGDGSHAPEGIPPRLRRDTLPSEEGKKTWAPALAALFGAGAWLLHPFLVSTTLYVVQREAMLPATFTLIAMLGWMASREALVCGHVKRALAGMALSAWLCTGLAVLSKANGALLPLLLLLVEWVVLARRPIPDATARRWHRRAVTVFLIVPAALLVAYLLYLIPGVIQGAPAVRDWTVGQRLLTEPRVLTDYLRLLFVPHAHSSGLFNDAFQVSTGWLHPASTLPCIVLILALIGAGVALRKRHPAIALALLFYFAAQLMESGWIPLELYFEHRNYLPAMLLFWPIGLALAQPGSLRSLRILAAVAILGMLAMLTSQRAALWGNAPRQAQVWAAINPDSARAQTSAALYDLQNHRPRLAAARLRLAMPKHPDDLQIPVNLITAECKLGTVQPGTLAAARTALANDRVGGEVAFNWFGEALVSIDKHACRGLDYGSLQSLLDAANENPHWRQHAGLRVNLLHLQGTLELAQHQPRKALHDFNFALAQKPEPDIALGQAATLGAADYPALGLAHLDYFRTLEVPRKTGFSMSRIHAWVLHKQGWWQAQVAYLRATLAADAAAKHAEGAAK